MKNWCIRILKYLSKIVFEVLKQYAYFFIIVGFFFFICAYIFWFWSSEDHISKDTVFREFANSGIHASERNNIVECLRKTNTNTSKKFTFNQGGMPLYDGYCRIEVYASNKEANEENASYDGKDCFFVHLNCVVYAHDSSTLKWAFEIIKNIQ